MLDTHDREAIRKARLLIIDFDGTLVRLTTDWNEVKDMLHGELGSGFRDNIDTDLRKLRKVSEEAFKACCKMIARKEIAGFGSQVNLELLLVARRAKNLAICSSNTHEAIETILGDKVFKGLKPRIVGKEDVVKGKPDPEGLLLCLGDVKKKDAVFVGDSVVDLETGEQAGIKTIKIGMW